MKFSLTAALLAFILFLVSAHRLPAPIQEVQESPTPTSREHAKKSKPKETEAESPPKAKSKPAATTARKFAGIWRGVINCSVWGNIEHRIILDNAQTSMTVSRIGNGLGGANGTAKASVSPEGLTVDLGLGGKWALQPNSDGKTARVHLTGFMLDSSAVFTREL